MGLDMYAHAVDQTDVLKKSNKSELLLRKNAKVEDIHYWRKHHDLHGWMEKLYRENGGTKEFNCINIRLTIEDLNQLILDLQDKLPKTTGFFFGNNPPNGESLQDDMEFIRKAKEAISNGKVVFYSSWW